MASLDWDDPLRNLGPITEHPAPNSPISDEPSSALSDLEGFESIRERAERLLSVYRPISPDDRTVEILKIFLAHLPKEGQTALLSDIIAIGNNEADLRTLRSHLVDAILKPSKSSITPQTVQLLTSCQ
ncbi:methyltransferase [Trichoderma arundinaceum]|uniref:Methyltransferase n=1 Tax=Trichoderma arundinaceum TaxID=490622 RepID=A0A395NVC1_TRIAR|nr:methyltransferase [Trichoderma arundinaceum]